MYACDISNFSFTADFMLWEVENTCRGIANPATFLLWSHLTLPNWLSLCCECHCGGVSSAPCTSQECALDIPRFTCPEGRSPDMWEMVLEMLLRAKLASRGAGPMWPTHLPISSLSIHKSSCWTSLLVSCFAQFLTNAHLCFFQIWKLWWQIRLEKSKKCVL